MQVTCRCGSTFEARNPRAKYCSDRCRKRAQRGPADVVELPAAPDAPPPAGEVGPVEAATLEELAAAGREATVLGRLALTHARRLDASGRETASGISSLSKELRAVMVEALRGAKGASAPQQLQDELAARRQRHGA